MVPHLPQAVVCSSLPCLAVLIVACCYFPLLIVNYCYLKTSLPAYAPQGRQDELYSTAALG